MPEITDKIQAFGGMDKDHDYPYIKQGNYIDALNIRHITQGGSTGVSIQNVLGTDLEANFIIPAVVIQNKTYRIYLSSQAVFNYSLAFYDANGLLTGTATWVSTINNLHQTFLDAQVAVVAATPTLIVEMSVVETVTAPDLGYFDFTVTGTVLAGVITGLEYSMVLTTDWTNPDLPAVIAEAIDVSMTGDPIPIGSYDLLGDLFIHSTPCHNLPAVVGGHVTTVTDNSGSFQLVTSEAHGLTSGMSVTISNGNDGVGNLIVGLNGIFLIIIVDDFTIILVNSIYAIGYDNTDPAIVTGYVNGYGKIGVATRNINSLLWTYVDLLRSKELNFRVPKMHDIGCEKNIFLTSDYFTDDYNVPRCFYYSGAYVLDGAILALNPSGKYIYGLINDETFLLLSSTRAKLTFTSQTQNGGNVYSGNHRYTFCFVTENFTRTSYAELGNPINVCKADVTQGRGAFTGSQYDFGGDDALLHTSKINNFLITNIPAGLFKYVELVDINYVDTGLIATTVRRDLLTGNSTQVIQHTGLEVDAVALDVALLNSVNADILTAKNISTLDNRLIISNITTSAERDFGVWAETFTHTVRRKKITAVGSPQAGTYAAQEYIIPVNVNNYVGYCFNEIHRFALNVELKNGGKTLDFWIDDVRFDCFGFNGTNIVGTPNSDNRRVPVTVDIATVTNVGTTVTITTITPHGLDTIGQSFTTAGIVGYTTNNPNGTFTVASLVSSNIFTFIAGAAPTGTATPNKGTVSYIGLPSYDMTDNTGLNMYIPYVEFNNINFDFIIDGVAIKDLISKINIHRVDLVDSMIEVRGSGVAVAGVDMTAALVTGAPYDANILTYIGNSGWFMDYPFAAGEYLYDQTPQALPNNANYNFTAYVYTGFGGAITPVYVRERNYFSFYSPDYIYNNLSYGFESGDKIINFGSPREVANDRIGVQGIGGGCAFYSNLREYVGFVGTNTYQAGGTGVTVGDGQNVGQGHTGTVNTQAYVKNFVLNVSTWAAYPAGAPSTPSGKYFETPSSPVIYTTSGLNFSNSSGGTDYGVYQTQYYRFRGSLKFGNITTSKYIPTGTSYEYTSLSPLVLDNLQVFGGDVFTQKYFIKNVLPNTDNADVSANSYRVVGFGSGFSFYSQNRVNTQMKNVGTGFQRTQYDYPYQTNTDWLENEPTPAQIPVYNFGYSIRNEISAEVAFDENNIVANDMPTRVYWSELKPQDSVKDNYRSILPLNFHDLDLTYGEIIHHAACNGELVTWQPRKFQRQFFNTRGELQIKNAGAVVIGDGSVMSRDGQTFSVIGCSNKWSIIRGKSQGGKDVFYYINVELKKVIRFGEDGTKCISDIEDMQSFWANNLRWVDGKDIPTTGEGIYGVWDDRNCEAVWTLRGFKPEDDWTRTSITYTDRRDFLDNGSGKLPVGDFVSDGTFLYGVTNSGGANAIYGGIYKFTPASSAYTLLHSFNTGAGGSKPISGMTIVGNILYGTTRFDGANNLGTFFSYHLGTNTYTTLFSFSNATGYAVTSSPIQIGGVIYLTCLLGGTNNVGTLLRWNGSFTKLRDFATVTGSSPRTKLINAGSGIIYGTAEAGGVNSNGVIFKWDTNTSTYSVLHSFTGLEGTSPAGFILSSTDTDILYGTMSFGGAGRIYQYKISVDTYTSLADFNSIPLGEVPVYGITEYQGFIYGVCSLGGFNSVGTVWRYGILNQEIENIHDFTPATGTSPQGGMIVFSSRLYGTTNDGGANGVGVVYRLTITRSVYQTDDEVIFETSAYEEIPQIYISLIDNNEDLQPDLFPQYWRAVESTDNNYYNEYTIAFNEQKNKFTTKYTFRPKIMLKWKDSFLSPDPVADNHLYLHNVSRYCRWYNGNNEDGYIELNYAKDENMIKALRAILLNCVVPPKRIEFFTNQHESFLIDTDFELRLDQYTSSIKNDTLTSLTSSNEDDTTELFGQYVRIKIYFENNVFQKVVDSVLKFFPMSRSYRK